MNMSAKTVETHWTEAEDIADRVERLSCHPLYESLGSVNQLRLFMEHHVFAVWDFMSLLKFLQAKFAPTEWPWLPPELPAAARFVNEIALCEESDHGVEDEQFISHFELYLSAMEEIGANTKPIGNFMRDIRWSGLGAGLSSRQIPPSARRFTKQTFDLLRRGKTHEVAAAFALGRERAVPNMFRGLLARLGIGVQVAPVFHHYLDRHMEIDDQTHGPLSLELLDLLCEGNPGRQTEALAAGKRALENRLRFWEDILLQLQ